MYDPNNPPLEPGEVGEDERLLDAEQPDPTFDDHDHDRGTDVYISDQTIAEMMAKAKNESVHSIEVTPAPPTTETVVKKKLWNWLFPKHKNRRQILNSLLKVSVFYTICQAIYFVIVLGIGSIPSASNNPMLGPSHKSLSDFGGKNSLLIHQGEVYRLITPAFLYGGVIDAILGMGFQLFLSANILEGRWGPWKLLVVYFGSIFSAMIASCSWAPTTLSVGAIPAITGLAGARLADLASIIGEPVVEADPRRWKMRVVDGLQAFLPAIIFMLLGNGVIPNSPIDTIATVIGFLSGILIGFALFSFNSRHLQKRIGLAGSSIAILLTSWIVLVIQFFGTPCTECKI